MDTKKLTQRNLQYFNEVKYALDNGKPAGNYDVINHLIEECRLFESASGTSVTDWLQGNHPEVFEEFKK